MIAIEPIIFFKGCNSKHKNIYLVYSGELLNCHKVTMAFAWFGGRAFKFLLHRILYKNWFYIKIDRATSRAICFCAFQRNPKQTYYYKTFSVQFSAIRNLFNLYVVTGQIKCLAQTKYLQMHERYNVTTAIWDWDNLYFKQTNRKNSPLSFSTWKIKKIKKLVKVKICCHISTAKMLSYNRGML